MSKLGSHLGELRRASRAYTKSNREDWADLGFRYMTALVHDDERAVMLAEMEVRKCEAMIAMAEGKNTDTATLKLLSQRNMQPLPLPGDLTALRKRTASSTNKAKLDDMIDIAEHMIKKYRGLESAYEKVEDIEKRMRMDAKAVAYSCACQAHIKLVEAGLAFAPLKEKSIFGLRDDDEA
jgi:hypothetical protein